MNRVDGTEPREKSSGAGLKAYDLEERLLAFSAAIITFTDRMPNSRAGDHIAGQLLRSGTAALPNHGEAQAAESAADFVHKLKICFKELRETLRWIRLVRRVQMSPQAECEKLADESDQLIRIFVSSVRTANTRRQTAKRNVEHRTSNIEH